MVEEMQLKGLRNIGDFCESMRNHAQSEANRLFAISWNEPKNRVANLMYHEMAAQANAYRNVGAYVASEIERLS